MFILRMITLNGNVCYEGEGGGDGGGDGGEGGDKGIQLANLSMESIRPHLSEGIRNHESISTYQDLEQLVQGTIHARQMVSKDPSQIMDKPDTSSAEALVKHLSGLGVPEDAKAGYVVPKIEGLPEQLAGDAKFIDGFKDVCKEVGVLPFQFGEITKWFFNSSHETLKAEQTNVQSLEMEDKRTLEAAWGPEGSASHNQRTAAEKHAVDKLGGEKLGEALKECGADTHPVIRMALANVGIMMAEDRVGGDENDDAGGDGNTNRFNSGPTPDEAKQKAKELTRESLTLMHKDPRRSKELAEEAVRMRQLAKAS